MSWVHFTLRVVVFRFYYSVFSTYNFDTYQFGYQHELVSFCELRKYSAPQLSAGPLGRKQYLVYIYKKIYMVGSIFFVNLGFKCSG